MIDFIPNDYEVPSGSDKYMKLQKGENRLRVLSEKAILGYEWWIDLEDGKRSPVRVPMSQPIPVAEIEDPESIKHFWAMVVWNYQIKKIQILEITQKTIQRALRALLKDEEWGSPRNYDIVITKEGDTKENTKYQTLPKPAKKLEDGIEQLYKDMHINLNALYKGKDPFAVEEEKVNPDDIPENLGK